MNFVPNVGVAGRLLIQLRKAVGGLLFEGGV